MKHETRLQLVCISLLVSIAFFAIGIIPVFAQEGPTTESQGQNGTTLSAEVSLANTYTRTFQWQLAKSVSPATLNLFTGDSGAAAYTIAVTKTVSSDALTFSGQVCVTNGGSVATENLAITAFVTMPPSTAQIATTTVSVSSKPVLGPGESDCYNYQFNLSGGQIIASSTYKVTADVTITDHSGHLGTAFGPSPSNTTNTAATPVLIDDTVTVNDTNGQSWQFNDTRTETYTKTFACGADQGSHLNTATLDLSAAPDLTSSATVAVNCYGLGVTKTANTTLTRTYLWTIDKSVDQPTLPLFIGDTGSVIYTVTVSNTGYVDSNWAVSGSIAINNPAPMSATINSVSDVLTAAGAVTPTCGVTLPYALAAGGTLNCAYSANLLNGNSDTNTATAVLQNYTYNAQNAGTPASTTNFSGSAAVDFTTATVTKQDESVTVTDSVNGLLGTASLAESPKTFPTYQKSFTCGADQGKHDNIAEFTTSTTSAKGSDNASVTVNCYGLTLSLTTDPEFTRTYTWTIAKGANQTTITLALGQKFLVDYTVTPDATFVDSATDLAGKITIANPAPIPAPLSSVAVVVNPTGGGSVPGTVDCHSISAVPAGGTLVCDYIVPLNGKVEGTATATATLANNTSFSSAPKPYTFVGPTSQIDECVTLVDDKAGSLGSKCYQDLPTTITYSLWIGPYGTCGDYTFINTVTFTTNDTSQTGSASVTVNIDVPCTGCTLTQGYWKTHSGFGPAPYDNFWGGAENGPFFNSGLTWYQILWTPPSGGNAYIQLAHQFIAAWLNRAHMASSTPAVDTALQNAVNFFSMPNMKPSTPLTKPQRSQLLSWAATLEAYNSGGIGPGHCSEQWSLVGGH